MAESEVQLTLLGVLTPDLRMNPTDLKDRQALERALWGLRNAVDQARAGGFETLMVLATKALDEAELLRAVDDWVSHKTPQYR